MGLFWAKYARRIFAIVSTTSIPNLAPVSPTEATVDPPSRGSRLDADHPENGVLIPRRFTYDLCPSVSSVVPVFTLARTKVSIEAAELSGIAARRMRPDRVSRYFARFRLGLAWFVPRSITSTAPAIRIFPDFTGSKKLLSARKGISAWSTSTTPSSGSRWGSIIDRRSFCASNQAVLYVTPSWASSWTADMPFECVAMRCAAQNHTVSGNFDRCITVPAVIDVWRPQSRHS